MFYREEEPAFDDSFILKEVFLENAYLFNPKWVKGGVVIDIGANIGSFSIIAASSARKVFAYEPEPHNFSLLKKNIALNELENKITAFNLAIGKPGETRINNASGHSQINQVAGDIVKVIGLDQVFTNNSIKNCRLLKLDCEGAEYEAIDNTSDGSLTKIDRILGEFHSWIFEAEPEKHRQLINRLKKFFKLSYWGYKKSNFMGVKK